MSQSPDGFAIVLREASGTIRIEGPRGRPIGNLIWAVLFAAVMVGAFVWDVTSLSPAPGAFGRAMFLGYFAVIALPLVGLMLWSTFTDANATVTVNPQARMLTVERRKQFGTMTDATPFDRCQALDLAARKETEGVSNIGYIMRIVVNDGHPIELPVIGGGPGAGYPIISIPLERQFAEKLALALGVPLTGELGPLDPTKFW
jgi:hypothetical protein